MRVKFLDDLPRDKLLHCLIGVIGFMVLSWFVSIEITFLLVIFLGIFIEAQQWYFKSGQLEFLDAAATWIGGLIGLGMSL
jgi:glycopeptide antibiotics resistance protein